MPVLQKLKVGIFVVFLFGISDGALAAPGDGEGRQGLRWYHQGKFTEALDSFERALEKDAQSPRLNFNAGTAAFRAGRFADAAGYFRKALLTDDDAFRSQAAYNLGNALFMEGQSLAARPREARSRYEESLRHLSGIPADHLVAPDARHNARIVQAALDALVPPPSGQDSSKDQDSGDQRKDDEDSGKNCPPGKPASSQDGSGESSEESSRESSGEQDESSTSGDSPDQETGENAANQQNTAQSPGEQSEDGASSEQARDASGPDHPEESSAGAGAVSGSKQKERQTDGESIGSTESSQRPEGSVPAGSSGGGRAATESVAFTPEEARILLNTFQEREPGGLLNFYRGSGEAETGYKDW